jgi:hypothetical protein
MKKIIVLILILFLFAIGSHAQVDEKVLIEKNIRDSIGWALTKDRPLLESVLIHDDRLFIFNPYSHSTMGWSQFVKGFDFWMDRRFKMERFEIRNLRIDISISGTVAWWSCILDEFARWENRPLGWKDTRWTGVIEKRAGKWLIVQMHFSFAGRATATSPFFFEKEESATAPKTTGRRFPLLVVLGAAVATGMTPFPSAA